MKCNLSSVTYGTKGTHPVFPTCFYCSLPAYVSSHHTSLPGYHWASSLGCCKVLSLSCHTCSGSSLQCPSRSPQSKASFLWAFSQLTDQFPLPNYGIFFVAYTSFCALPSRPLPTLGNQTQSLLRAPWRVYHWAIIQVSSLPLKMNCHLLSLHSRNISIQGLILYIVSMSLESVTTPGTQIYSKGKNWRIQF